MSELLVVVRVGVYDQGVCGVAETLQKAKEIAERAAAADRDTYHDFEVRGRSDGEAFSQVVWRLTAGSDRYARNRRTTRAWVAI